VGKRKKGAKKAVMEIVPDPCFRFFDLPQRKMLVVHLDMVEEDEITMNILPEEIPEGSIVKLVQRYRQDDQDQANRVLDEIMGEIKTRARYVRPPERVVVKERKVKSEKVYEHLAPQAAVDLWFELQDPTVSKEAIMELMRHYLMTVNVAESGIPRRMEIQSMAISDFMPFKGEHLLESIPSGLIGVVGRYDGQDGRSNRAGKSAFFDAIQFVLYGETRKVDFISDNAFDGMDSFNVGLGMSFDGDAVSIFRAYRNSQTVVQINNNHMPVKAGSKEIVGLMGMSQNDFVRTCFVKQGDLETILSRTSTKLKEDIVRWRGLHVWAGLDASCKKDVSGLENNLQKLEARLEVAQEAIDRGAPSLEEIESLQENLNKAAKHNAQIEASSERVRLLENELQRAITAVEFRATAKKRVKLSKKYLQATAKESESWQSFQDAYAKAESARKDFLEKNNLCSEGFDGVCPIDSLQCPRVVEINEERAALERAALESKQEHEKAQDIATHIKKRWEDDREVLTNVSRELEECENAEKEWNEYNGPTVPKARRDFEDAKKMMDAEYVDTDEMQDRLNGLMLQQKEYKKAVARKEGIFEEIEDITSRLKVMRYFRFMCGKYGIPNMMIEGSLREIESQVNAILEDLGTDHRLEFDTERELKRMSKVCFECGAIYDTAKEKFCDVCGKPRKRDVSDELRPMIVEGDRKQMFDQDSGAGRGLVALATRVAMSRFLGATVLFLDEISGMLDEYHLGMLIRFLHKLPSMGFTQVFVITHEQEVEDALQYKVYVTRYQEETRSVVSLG